MLRVPNPQAKDGLRDEHMFWSEQMLAQERILFVKGPLVGIEYRQDQFAPASIIADIIALNKISETDPIYLYIDSPGGLTGTGYVLFDVIKMSKAPVKCIAMNAASMATVVLQAGTERLAMPHSRVMIHSISSTFAGDETDAEIQLELMKDLRDNIIDSLIEAGCTAGLKGESAKNKKKIRAKILKDIRKNKWFTTEEAIVYGLVDREVTQNEVFN